MKIIAFTGKYQSGKTTIANFIINYYTNVIKLSFAEPVKKIATEQFGWNGEKDTKGRKLLQLIGTDVGREYNPNIWVEKMEINLKNEIYLEECKNQDYDTIVVIDDARFDNEAELIKKWNSIIIEIIRPGYNGDNHKSEQGINKKYIDYTIDNAGSLDELKNKIITIINSL